MSRRIIFAILGFLITMLSFIAWRVVQPHQARLLLGEEVEVIMTCREPLLTGDGLCLPEGHTYRGVYEAWGD